MRPLRYSINVTLDGCVDHRSVIPDEEMHRYATRQIEAVDAIILGRTTYEMMETGWRDPAQVAQLPEWMHSFADAIGAIKKYVVSSTLTSVDWNAEIVRSDLKATVERLKQEPGGALAVGGVQVPLALANWGLIDEYEFVRHQRIAGYGPTLLAGLTAPIDLREVGRTVYESGTVATRYEVVR